MIETQFPIARPTTITTRTGCSGQLPSTVNPCHRTGKSGRRGTDLTDVSAVRLGKLYGLFFGCRLFGWRQLYRSC